VDWEDEAVTLRLAQRIARHFKLSTLVAIRRLHEAGYLERTAMWRVYRAEHARLVALANRRKGGGNYYLSKPVKVSRRFAEAIYVSAWEGRSSFTEAMRLLNLEKVSTFEKLGMELGIAPRGAESESA
jgi:hypothetical protein